MCLSVGNILRGTNEYETAKIKPTTAEIIYVFGQL